MSESEPAELRLELIGPYNAKGITSFISTETTATGVRLTFSGPIAHAIVEIGKSMSRLALNPRGDGEKT